MARREDNLGYFARFMVAYGLSDPPTRVLLYMQTRAYSGGNETAAQLYQQISDELGVPVPTQTVGA